MIKRAYKRNEEIELVFIAVVVGLFGALASMALNTGLEHLSGWIAGFHEKWYALFFPAAGAFLAVFFMRNIAKDVGGHGVPEVIYSISRRGGLLRMRTSISRIIGCLLTIASGGSAGPEAPVVISGAAIGSNIGTYFRLRERQRIIAVGCGAAAAIAAIFNAPVAGIVFTMEAILGEWTPVHLIPVSMASVVATETSRLLQGNQIPFQHRVFSISYFDFAACIGLALFTALLAVLLQKILRGSARIFKRAAGNHLLRASAGGIIVGIIGLLLPAVLGEGYHVTHGIIEGRFKEGLLISALLIIGKIISTATTLGSGGIGGIFAPCLVIGSFAGLFYSRFIELVIPSIPWADQGYYGLLGMAGMISALLQAPMTGVFLITEITGSYQFLLSVLLVAVISTTAGRFFEPFSVYHQELMERRELVKPRTDRHILSNLFIGEIIKTDLVFLNPEMRLGEFARIFAGTRQTYFPVLSSKDESFCGLVDSDEIRPYLLDPYLKDTVLVEQVMERDPPFISADDDMETAFFLFEKTGRRALCVLQEESFLGLVIKEDVFDRYRKEMLVNEEI